MSDQFVLFETLGDGVAVVTLNRPAQANSVVPEMIEALGTAIERLDRDVSVRCAVLTGAGDHFCAGADLDGLRHYIQETLPVTDEPYNMRALGGVTYRLATLRLPVICALNGSATAGGLDLALACDIRIAAETARLGQTYVKVGLPLGNGGAWFLPRLVGMGVAAELAYTGDLVDAATARELGLVNRVVAREALLPEAITLAKRIASRPRRAVEAAKQALRASASSDLAQAMSSAFWMTSALQRTADFREGIDAAIEKRPGQFNRTVG